MFKYYLIKICHDRAFSTASHLQEIKEEITEGKETRDDVSNDKLERIVNDVFTLDHSLLVPEKIRVPG